MGESHENPLEGAGKEMLPERGLPVDEEALLSEAEEVLAASSRADVTSLPPEAAATGEAPAESAAAEEEEDHGMGAVEPITSLEDAVGLPEAEPALPPPESTRGMPYFSSESQQRPGPVEGLEGGESVGGSEGLQASQAMLSLLITEPVLRAMWERADHVQRMINERIDSVPLARQLLSLVERARNEILAGRDHYEEAERALSEAEYRVAFAKRVQQWSYTYGTGILIYELLWLAVCLIIGINIPRLLDTLLSPNFLEKLSQASSNPRLLSDLTIGITSMLWGCVGGVVGALHALWRHVARLQDFSKQYTMWYITNPLMGITLGAFTFLVIRAGMFSLTAGTNTQAISSAFAIYVLAWITGFQQNVALDMVRRILQLFRIQEEPSHTQSETK